MDPLTIMMLGSTALSAIGKLGAGFQGSSIDEMQQKIAQQNADLLVSRAKLEAESGQLAFAQGGLEASRTAAQIQRTLGGATAHFAASNLDPTVGSPLLVEGFSAGQGATDLALIAARASMGNAQALGKAAGSMAEAAGAQGQAAAFGMKATSDVMAGYFGAASSILSGLAGAKQFSTLNALAGSMGKGGMPGGSMFMPGSLY